jgi:chorismate synthase
MSGKEFHDLNQDYGGIRGGLSTGDPITLRVAFKPTSSRQDVALRGRHDPCIVPRAIPVLEAMAWLVLADQILLARLDRV